MFKKFFSSLFIGFLLVLCATYLYRISNITNKKYYQLVKTTFQKPVTEYQSLGVDWEHSVISLSLIAEGLVGNSIKYPENKKENIKLVSNIIETFLHSNLVISQNLDSLEQAKKVDNIYLMHLNIALGAYQFLTKSGKYELLNRRITLHLAKQILEAKNANLLSYNAFEDTKWTGDNSAALYAIYLYDKNFGQQISLKPIQKWINFTLKEQTDSTTQLPYSEFSEKDKYYKVPRGSSLSWTIKYLNNFAPTEAKTLWDKYYKHNYYNFVICGAFREYPKGIELGEDYDTGAIVWGFSGAASGLGLCAAKSVGSSWTYGQIDNVMTWLDWGLLSFFDKTGEYEKSKNDLLSISIRWNAAMNEKWFKE
jgi:hypothetical protein